ncbi:MAG: CHAD domain-containing protein [Micromonosporaceae bacterium]
MLEEERKYEVDAQFVVPDLSACVPPNGRVVVRPPLRLRATYLDTADLRLARAGASLRYRRGDDEPWTVKLPTAVVGIRNEISMAGSSASVPDRLLELVTVYTRGASLAPAVMLNTVRQAYQICDRDDQIAVELVDDSVSVLDGRRVALRFREIEVERKSGRTKLLDQVEAVLHDAGALVGDFTPKHIRALGLPALNPPDWPAPPERMPKRPTAADVVRAAIQRDIARIVTHDPLVRLRAPVGDNDTAVHQMRVGVRRLRSDLRTFAPILERPWATALRRELGWVAHTLGAARDAEVLRARLRETAAADPLVPLDGVGVERIDADLAARHEDALQQLDKALSSERYHTLLDQLVAAANTPRLLRAAADPAALVLPALVSRPWQRLNTGGDGAPGAGQLDPDGPDEPWHAVRINAKRARYAIDAVAAVLGGDAADLARALAAVQDLLGQHQDAAVAAQTWLSIANADPDDHTLAVTAGRLFERERTTVAEVRAEFPATWRAATKRRLTDWLRQGPL